MANPLINPGPDSRRTRLVCSFLPFGDFDPASVDLTSAFTGPAWNCMRFINASGRSPSSALCIIAVDKQRDETKPSVCCLPNNNFSKVKHGCIAQVTAIATDSDGTEYTKVVYVGYVSKIKQDIGKDIATITLHDFRHKMAGLPLIGTFFATADNDNPAFNTTSFLSGYHIELNPNTGVDDNPEPNCILSTEYNIPMFCTPNYGVQNNAVTPPVPIGFTPNQYRACWWTPQTFWQHLQWRFTSAYAFMLASTEARPFILPQIPKNLTWPTGLEDNLAVSPIYPVSDTRRKCFTQDFNGMDLNTILDQICKMYAIYGVAVSPIDGYQGQLDIVRTRTDDSPDTGVDLIRYVEGTPADQTDPSIVDGEFTTDSHETHSQIYLAGSMVNIEIVIPLTQVWAPTDYTKWYTDLKSRFAGFTGRVEKVITQVNKANLRVFNSYRPDPQYDIQIGTISNTSGLTEAGAPFADRGRAALDKLCSSQLPGTNNGGTSNNTLVERTNFQYPMYIQRDINIPGTKVISSNYIDPATGMPGTGPASWQNIAEQDQIHIDKVDGVFYLDGLRGNNTTYFPPIAKNINTVADLPPNFQSYALRACVALPLDHCLSTWKQLQCDTARPPNLTPAMVSAMNGIICDNLDTALIANNLNRMFYFDFGNDGGSGKGLYACNLANGSVPNPLAPGDVRTTDILDDTNYLNTHSYIRADDMTRLTRDGFFLFYSILPDWVPGILINNLISIYADSSTVTYPINSIIQGVEFTAGKSESTKLLLGKSS